MRRDYKLKVELIYDKTEIWPPVMLLGLKPQSWEKYAEMYNAQAQWYVS